MGLSISRGARFVSPAELKQIPAPEPTETWFPLSHYQVFNLVMDKLHVAGYEHTAVFLAVSRNNMRFFGTAKLKHNIIDGVTLAIGVRNSNDKSIPIGFCAGTNVVVCDNLAFQAELIVKRKHTLHGKTNFNNMIAEAIGKLKQFHCDEAERINMMLSFKIGGCRVIIAEALMLRAYELKIVSHRQLPQVIELWRSLSKETEGLSLWDLYNIFTLIMQPIARTNPERFARQTMLLGELLRPQ